jgi:hypothetical protein
MISSHVIISGQERPQAGAKIVLVGCQFRIYQASTASPLGEGERIKVRGCTLRASTGTKSSLPLALSLGKGEATRHGLTDNRATLPKAKKPEEKTSQAPNKTL